MSKINHKHTGLLAPIRLTSMHPILLSSTDASLVLAQAVEHKKSRGRILGRFLDLSVLT